MSRPPRRTALLEAKRYTIIYCDPPWEYSTQQHTTGGRTTGGACTHYNTMSLSELKKLDVAGLADDDCLLFMWATSPKLDEAVDLLRAWGFQWATVGFVWDKQKVNPGFYTMSQVELCLIGKKGRIPTPRGARNVRQFLSEMRGRHSAKPSEIRRRIEEMFPTQTKIELFARERVDGWDAWGNEVPCDVMVQVA